VKREVEHVVEPSRSKRFLKALKFWWSKYFAK
jgi:hypothetical protein